MDCPISAVSTKGQFVIPSEMRSAVGIRAGTRIAVTYDGAKITLQPVTNELVDATRGMLKGKAYPADKLRRKWRREDRWERTYWIPARSCAICTIRPDRTGGGASSKAHLREPARRGRLPRLGARLPGSLT